MILLLWKHLPVYIFQVVQSHEHEIIYVFYQVFMSLVLLFIAMWRKLKYCSTYYVIWFQLRMCVTYFRSRSHDATITCHICTFRITYMNCYLRQWLLVSFCACASESLDRLLQISDNFCHWFKVEFLSFLTSLCCRFPW